MSVEYIRLDIVPSVVQVLDADGNVEQVWDTCRTIITNDEVHVYRDAYGGPAEVIGGPLYDVSGNNKTNWRIEIDNGPTLIMNRSRGCACGSMLRGFNPFVGVPYVGMTE